MRMALLAGLLVGWCAGLAPCRAQSGAEQRVQKPAAGKTVGLEARDADIGEVLRLLFDQTGEKGIFPEFGTSRKLTALLKEIPFDTALSLVANAAGLKVEKRDDTWFLTLPGAYAPTGAAGSGRNPLTFALSTAASIPTVFACQGCQRTATVLMKPADRAASCGKCRRALQTEWEFCPGCGEKRAADESFVFCPFCGKQAPGVAHPREASSSERRSTAWLGVRLRSIEEDRERLGLNHTSGARVLEVMKDSPAAAAGVQTDDIVVAVNGKSVEKPEEVQAQIRAQRPGDYVTVTLRRGDKTLRPRVRLVAMPDATEPAKPGK